MNIVSGSRWSLELHGVGRVFKNRGVTNVALEDVSFSLQPGATIAVVGESGAGKSTLTRLIAGLDRPTHGEVLVDGAAPVVRAGQCSTVQIVFQNPEQALSPYASVGASVGEPLRTIDRKRRRDRVAELLAQVGIDPERVTDRPRKFSGGQLQRIALARALAARPKVLLCDEPTSALDVSVQAQIVNLILRLQATEGFACVLVTHDLHVARVLADDVLVLRRGRIVEHTDAVTFFERPEADYSRGLLSAMANPTDRDPRW